MSFFSDNFEENAKWRAPHPFQQTLQFTSSFVLIHQVIFKFTLIIYFPLQYCLPRAVKHMLFAA